jgi:hypothetical protein
MALLALVSGLVALDPRVDACGGCFSAATFTTTTATGSKTAQVLTDHRMVLSLSSERTTLWDQIRDAGSPDDFPWVLPVAPDADLEIGLADNAFVDAGSAQTGDADFDGGVRLYSGACAQRKPTV